MINDRIEISMRKNKIIMSYEENREVIFDEREYNDKILNFNEGNDNTFKIIHEKYGVNEQDVFEKNFLYLFNFVLVNNISNYIKDVAIEKNYKNIVFDEKLVNGVNEKIKLSGRIDAEDVIGNIFICLVNSDEYTKELISVNYGKILNNDKKIEKLIREDIEYYFNYERNSVKTLKEKVEEYLIKSETINVENKNKEDRYILPIYIDEEELDKKIGNYGEFLINWTSIAYFEMLKTIHDNFTRINNLELDLGLKNDDLTLALISLLDAEITDYPKGLEKSIEKGREKNGKCYFIEKIVTPIAIPQDVAMILQSRDAFEVVPDIFKTK